MGLKFQTNKNIKFKNNEFLLGKIDDMEIKKYYKTVFPAYVMKDSNKLNKKVVYDKESGVALDRKDSCVIDFGDHTVGRINLQLDSMGSPPDAPVKFKLYFGETLEEALKDPSEYTGVLSASWFQEELLTVDVLPANINLERRFTFRYVRIQMIDTSPKFSINLKINCITETSADLSKMELLETKNELIKEIDRVSQITLAQCMQEVYEDGPKRDRRMWLGDLRLQALANYKTFGNNLLVKKSLYRFAAITTEEGQVSANVFVQPKLIPDDTFLIDYSLFFGDTLLEYYKETKDAETLIDLYETALNQIEISKKYIQKSGEIKMGEGWNAHIDWSPELEKSVSTHAVFIYTFKKMKELAKIKKDHKTVEELEEKINLMEEYALEKFYTIEDELFINPEGGQKSIHSQVWMVLAEVGDKKLRETVLKKLLKESKDNFVGSTTPYMYHHFVEALFIEGFKEEAIDLVLEYWGGMIQEGADTFWEIYNPEDLEFSPYGDHLINSYCHAWSCTPCYLFREYGVI